jgi:hypothetical protein
MKRDAFAAKGLRIETSVDWTSRWYVVWKPDVSVYCRTRKEVLKFASWPTKTPTGDSLRAWLDQMEAIDQERVSKKAQPLTGGPLMEGKAPNLSQEVLATGFGPECHLDESDPNYQTKMVT